MEILILSIVLGAIGFCINSAKKVSEITSSKYTCNKESVEI